jgi:hypothetical protein
VVRPVLISDQPQMKMVQGASLEETIAKGKRHYYNGVTFRNWKLTMLKMYGGDTRPFLEEAWSAVIGDAESRARANREKLASSNPGTGTRARPPGPITFLGNATMLFLNAITCLALFSAWKSGHPYPFDTKLTWLCFAAFSITTLWRMKDGAAILCLPLACVFNPFYPIHLARSVWSIIDVVSLILLAAISLIFLVNAKK